MSDKERIRLLRAELLRFKIAYYAFHRCTFGGARAKRDIEQLLGEPITPHKELDAQERENRYAHITGE